MSQLFSTDKTGATKLCGYRKTTTGHPCENPVEGGHDHCRAGHPVVVSAPALSTVQPHKTSAPESSLAVDELLVVGGQAGSTPADFAEGKEVETRLTEALDNDYEYTETIRGESADGKEFSMALFVGKGEEPDVLGYGKASTKEKRKRWFYVTDCEEPHAVGDDGRRVFWELSSGGWYGNRASKVLQERRNELFEELALYDDLIINGAGSHCSLHEPR